MSQELYESLGIEESQSSSQGHWEAWEVPMRRMLRGVPEKGKSNASCRNLRQWETLRMQYVRSDVYQKGLAEDSHGRSGSRGRTREQAMHNMQAKIPIDCGFEWSHEIAALHGKDDYRMFHILIFNLNVLTFQESEFKCAICIDTFFPRKEYLTKHMKNHHSDFVMQGIRIHRIKKKK